ncbi:MAG TPA: hypothetical protein PK263_00650 [bacterium]|nr:hypothetical protein [bacterium]
MREREYNPYEIEASTRPKEIRAELERFMSMQEKVIQSAPRPQKNEEENQRLAETRATIDATHALAESVGQGLAPTPEAMVAISARMAMTEQLRVVSPEVAEEFEQIMAA